jgi:amino acid adenylation domain-containing protein
MNPNHIETIVELSPMQQAMLFHSLMAPGSGVYVLQMSLRLTGRLDLPAFERAWQHLVARHSILRTAFFWEDLEIPRQVVFREAALKVSRESWRDLDADKQRERLVRYLDADQERGFDLAAAPLMRLALFELSPDVHQLVWTQHHMVIDGWSQGHLLRELLHSYAELAQGREPRLERPRSFREYIGWLQRQDLGQAEAFWRRSLAGFHAPTFMAEGDGRVATSWQQWRRRDFALPADTTEALRETARRHRLALNTLVQGAWALLLAQATDREDVLFGATVAGRPADLPGVEAIIGPFINTLPVRVAVQPERRLREWLTGMQAHLTEMRRYEHSPLVDVQRWSELPGGVPLFDHILVFENLVLPKELSRPLPDLDIVEEAASSQTNYPLNLIVVPGQELSLSFFYDAGRFETASVIRMQERLALLLTAFAKEGDPKLREIPKLLPAERQQLIEWNATGMEVLAGLCVHHLVEAQVERTPEALAVVRGGDRLTYRELNERANRLAHLLRRLGVRPEERVGIFIERVPSLVVSLLAVLKAGGAYVPIDPSYPGERVGSMVEDAKIRVIVVGAAVEAKLPRQAQAPGVRLVRLGSDQEAIARESSANPESGVLPENLSYLIYTSGSTGRPKGVAIQHNNAVSMLRWALSDFDDEESAVVVLATSISFDVSVLELFFTLARGSKLVVAENVLELPHLPEAGEITMVNATPSALAEMLRNDPLPASVLTANVGGEAVPRRLVDKLYSDETVRMVRNAYGPSENTSYTTLYPIERESERIPPLGRPIANGRMVTLDRHLQPLPTGVAGELYVGGAGVARGYLDRPEMTAEKFLPDPFVEEPGARMYKVGDIVRVLPDGRYEFLGRIDHQVKVRGFRIELGEIEEVLLGHPGIAEAAVVVREDTPGDKRLVAYLTAAPGGRPETAELRGRLAEKLPEHMIPSGFVFLDALPKTPSGKIDRRTLGLHSPEPERETQRSEEPAAPTTPVGELVAGIWTDVLGLDRVGTDDDFFALGGHSLLATRVVSRLREAFGVDIPLRELFENPRLADLAAWIETARRAGAGRPAPPLVPLAPALRAGALPLSFAQQRLWIIDQLEPGSPLYNIPLALRVEGPLDSRLLARCLGEIVRRHEVLRTVFAVRDGAPEQVIQPASPFVLPVVDLSGLPGLSDPSDRSDRSDLKARQALALAAEEAARPFDLSRRPLLRGVLLRLGEGDHVAALTMHHIASDGWSLGLLMREVGTLYAAFAEGRPSPLPELPVQYADFAVWQHSWLHGELLDNEISYWRRQLAGLPPLLDLPTDRPRPAVQSYRGSTVPVRLTADLTWQAEALARSEGATLFMVLLAGFQTLLARLSGQPDLAVGTPVAGRNRIEIEGLIGFFVNTLVLRGDLTDEPTFSELLGRVRETALAAHTHQDVPFEKLVEELAPERSLAHTPLFQVMLVLQNAPVERLDLRSLRWRPMGGAATTAKLDLTMSLGESHGELAGAVEYATHLFDATTIDRLISQYETLLTAALTAPELPVLELPILGAAERHQLLAEWNDTAGSFHTGVTLHELVAEQAARTPELAAASFEGEELTYRELVERAGALAGRLVRVGVVPEDRVGVRMDRSLDLIVALLATLKAGAAYVPLDPTWPEERLRQIAASAGARVVLPLAPGPPALTSGSFPASRRGEDSLAYVIFTSGSTGVPKGVMIPHRGIVNRLLWMQEAYGLTSEDRVLQKTPFTFDVSVWEFFWPLLVGARLVLARPEGHKDPAYLVDLIAREKITTLHFVPSMLQAFLEAPGLPALTSVRRVMASGEALPPELVRRFFERLPHAALHNLYGPTEASVDVSFWPCVPEPPRSVVPIGRPISNLRLHVMDRGLRPVPIGVAGELLLGGVGLARGYLGRPELTAAAFVPDPCGGEPGGRLYRTGDLTRFLPDGQVEYLGRIDFQVKIRGFRIELGEIEAALTALDGVREAAVVVREDLGEKRLVAYVVGEVFAAVLRQALLERLPDSMVPAAFVKLAALPLTLNGKLDRKALPPPERQTSAETWQAPRTPVEEVLAGIWGELLGFERVGVDDHFFALGGHSLMATRVLSRLREVFGVQIPLRELFEAPRLADFAERIAVALRKGTGRPAPPLVPLAPALRAGALPLSFAQQRLWFIDQLEPGSPLYNIPVALRVEGPLDAGVLARCLGEIVRRHEVLRTAFAVRDGAPEQVIQPASPFVLPLIDLSGLPETERESQALSLVREEAVRPFDLGVSGQGPLLRGVLLRLAAPPGGQPAHVVALTMHHIASDGWSLGLLVREVGTLYAAFAEGRPSPLPELPVQYADFAVWQHSWLHGELLDNEISFWRRQLADLPPLLELPTDRPRPAVQRYRGSTVPVCLTADLTRQAEALARREGATLFMVLLAGFQALLARLSGQPDLAVGTPVAGRNRIETEGLIGFFVNTLVLRGDLRGEPSFRELLGRVRETSLTAHLHQEVPFEKLVEELAPERSLAHAPLFQVMLALQNVPVESLEIGDLRWRPVGGAGTTAKLDLTMSLGESDGELAGTVEHATDLFDATTIGRLISQYETLLTAALAAPELPVAELPMLGAGERQQLLCEWSDTAASFPREATIHGLFAEQPVRRPGAVAVELGAEKVTWDGLRHRAGRIARRLAARGLRPEERVAVLAERSPDLIAALLGILQAGGAYLPLDPALPAERLAWMVRDAAASLLVAHRAPRIELPAGLELLDLPDLEGDNLEGGGPEAELPRVPADALAYVMYTSGSTGTPKGVAVTHRNVIRLVRGAEYADLGPDQTWLQAAPVSFDASTLEIWAPLLNGGRLVLLPGHTGTLGELAEVIAAHGVTSAWLTAGLFHEMVNGCPEGLRPLTQLLTGGDVVSSEHARRALAAHPGLTLIDGYGPTEGTTFTCCHRLTAAAQVGASLPIGRPIANARVHVLDAHGAPVPVGAWGELAAGGEGLARGYLGRPDLTAERFVPDPFGQPGGRLYRTGDRVRRRPDGLLEFLGRFDHQVKIRGFRIEPGEIEAALAVLPGVREAVVISRSDQFARSDPSAEASGGRRLVAYLVGDAPPDAELRRLLAERLPSYMVPAAFVRLAALPLTPNGKVDRKALPIPEPQSPKEGFVAPRTPVEELLAGIWSDVLGLERVGAADDFFTLGGHSLLAVRLMARIEHVFGVKLPLSALFEAPTVEHLARAVQRPPVRRSMLVRLHPGGSGRPFFLIHPAGGHVFDYVALAKKLGEERPVYGLQAVASSNGHPARMEDLAAQYLALVREVQPEGPWLLAGWSSGAVMAYEMARQTGSSGGGTSLLTMLDPPVPPDGRGEGVNDTVLLAGFAALEGLSTQHEKPFQANHAILQGLDVEAGIDRLVEAARAAEVLRPGVDEAWVRERFALFRRTVTALYSYLPRPYGGRVTLFRAGASLPPGETDITSGWGVLARMEAHLFPDANHYTLLQGPALDRLVEQLRSDLALVDA